MIASACSDSKTTSDTAPTVKDSQSVVHAIEQSERYIVEFEPGSAAAGRAEVSSRGEVLLEIFGTDAVAARLPDAAVTALQNNPNIRRIEKDPVRKPTASPSSTNQEVPYGIDMVGAGALSDAAAGNRTVCIIDSGYDMGHEDLQTSNVTGVTPADSPVWNEDTCAHGTHVAGTIAAMDNDRGVVGVNPSGNLNLHIVRVFGDGCQWTYASNLADAANRCAAAGANVISMSLGCAAGATWRCASSLEDETFQALYDGRYSVDADGNVTHTQTPTSPGILNVAAASNDGKPWYSYPASYDSVISVAAIDSNKNHASFSNSNDAVEISAPGVDVWSTLPMDENNCYYCTTDSDGQKVPANYAAWNGTSMATPHVAGVAALVWSLDTTLTNEEIRAGMTDPNAVEDLGPAGRDDDYGYGLVRADLMAAHLGLNSGPVCGDGTCDDGEDAATCADCAVCENGVCEAGEDGTTCSECAECDNDVCELGEDGATCPECAVCGNDACEAGEDASTCPDCAECGNGTCEAGETNKSCASDCDPVCGNDVCETGEDPLECADCAVCGNGTCEAGEDGNNCADCAVCDNGTCEAGEDESNCAADCEVSCTPAGQGCGTDGDCCSNKCKGKPGDKTCK